MNKIDIFVIAVPEFDSPMIRDFIHRYHDKFNKISYIINVDNSQTLSESENQYIDFIRTDLQNKATVVISNHVAEAPHDWRSACLKEVISNTDADYLFSIEPDFIGDWDKIVDIMLNKNYSIFTNYTAAHGGTIRLWPSFWGCKTELLKKTDLIFSAMPAKWTRDFYNVNYNKIISYDPPYRVEVDHKQSSPFNMANSKKLIIVEVDEPSYDHFDYVSTQIVDMIKENIDEEVLLLNRMPDIWWEHMTGITHDYMCMVRDGKIMRPIGVYKRFYDLCRMCNVKFFSKWLELSDKILQSTQ